MWSVGESSEADSFFLYSPPFSFFVPVWSKPGPPGWVCRVRHGVAAAGDVLLLEPGRGHRAGGHLPAVAVRNRDGGQRGHQRSVDRAAAPAQEERLQEARPLPAAQTRVFIADTLHHQPVWHFGMHGWRFSDFSCTLTTFWASLFSVKKDICYWISLYMKWMFNITVVSNILAEINRQSKYRTIMYCNHITVWCRIQYWFSDFTPSTWKKSI